MFTRLVHPHRRRAVTAVFVATLLPVILGFAALTVDVGLAYNVKTELQIAADAAALAGVLDLAKGDVDEDVYNAVRAAVAFVGRNPVLNEQQIVFDPMSDIKLGQAGLNEAETKWLFDPGVGPPNAIQVTVHYEVEYSFARLFGLNSANIHATGVAAVTNPITVPVIPTALPTPGFGPVDPKVANHNPGKTGPSEPGNGEYFEVGEEIVLFVFGKGVAPPVHLVLDTGDTKGDINKMLEGYKDMPPISIGDELPVVNDGVAHSSSGNALVDRYEDPDLSNTIVMPIVETTSLSRNQKGELTGMVRVVDFVAVTIMGMRTVTVANPDAGKKDITMEVLVGEVIRLHAGVGDGSGTTAGMFNGGSLLTRPQLIM